MTTSRFSRLEALGALAEPLRRRTYEYVAAQSEPVNRDATAAALDVARSVAAFHLDKLVQAGLLDVEYRRPPGRSGPGAGRPTKWYRAVEQDVALSVPERRYEVAASLLAQSLAETPKSDPARKALKKVARRYGRALAASSASPTVIPPALGRSEPGPSEPGSSEPRPPKRRLEQVSGLLEQNGYHPRIAGDELTLENCPFRAVADLSPELICAMNLECIQGVLDEFGDPSLAARLEPAPGRCCVTVTTRR